MIPPDRWQHVERLYHAALARDEDDRAQFLREACRDDEPLRREIESLLAYSRDAEELMRAPALEVAAIQNQDVIPASLVGVRLGVYEIGALLGAGGMGDVYRARDTTLGRDVAIKILPGVFTADAGRRARFEREARLLASLNHPNIGAIYGFEQRDGVHGLVLELVEGQTLAERLRGGALPMRDAHAIARQIAEALEAAHEKGIAHRDLKPSNVMITPDGHVKVLDFGLASARAAIDDAGSAVTDDTRDGLILGTSTYMSPEQVRGRRADKRTDIWAFGCVVWEMLTGRAPFAAATLSDTVASILEREPAWDALPPDTPENVRRLLRRSLEKDPKRRLRDAGDAQLELDDISVTPPAASIPRRREVAAWSAAILCLLGALALGYALFSTPPPSVSRFHVLPPADGPIRGVAVSPDGRSLAFVSIGHDKQDRLWVRTADSPEARALEGTEGAGSPFWSPDGRYLAFFSRGRLRKVAASGGVPQVLCDAADPLNSPNGGTWSPDGTILFAPVGDGVLYRVSANGGTPVPVTTRREGESGHRFPQFLPDGRHFLFLARAGGGTPGGIYVGSLDSPDTVLVLETVVRAQYAPPGYLLFIRGNALMAQAFDPRSMRVSGDVISIVENASYDAGGGAADFSVAGDVLAYRQRERTIRELQWVDRAGQRVETAGPVGHFIHPWLSPDGRQAVVEIADPDTGAHAVWMLDLARGLRWRFGTGPDQRHFPVWSADGRSILFSSEVALFTKPASGVGDEVEFFKGATSSLALDWSHDGRFLLYQAGDPVTRSDIWALPIAPRAAPFAVANSASNERQAQLSPDGRWVAYVSDAGGRDEVWVQGFPQPTERSVVSTAGGSQPQWRRDGRELFYVASDLRLMAMDVGMGGSSFEPGVPRALFALQPRTVLHARNNYVPAPDGTRFLVNTTLTEPGSGSMAVVLNWEAVVRGR